MVSLESNSRAFEARTFAKLPHRFLRLIGGRYRGHGHVGYGGLTVNIEYHQLSWTKRGDSGAYTIAIPKGLIWLADRLASSVYLVATSR
jgi:hypothetical protein